jgi:WD40 repeat protein
VDALLPFSGHTGAVTGVEFSPDGKTLATGADDTTVLLWDLAYRPKNTK